MFEFTSKFFLDKSINKKVASELGNLCNDYKIETSENSI